MRVSYNSNAGLALDADLALLLDVELTVFSGSHLSGNAELTGSCLMQSTELLKLVSNKQRNCRV